MIIYIDSASFSNATSVFLDELLTIIAPDGYYSDGSYYRKQVGGKLIDLLVCPNIDTVSITNVGQTTATFNGNLISNGGDVNAIRGFVYGTSTNPTTANTVVTDLVNGAGTYSLNVTGLTPGITYYVKAYAIVFGETIYGDQLSVKTVVIDTVSITNVGQTTATFNGELISDGGDATAIRGFVYGTSQNPTLSNNVIIDTVRGQGTYSLNATGLTSGVTYYVRAYTTVYGNTVYYGDQLNFVPVVIVPCGQSNPAGGAGIEDLNVSLDSIGGVIVFLLDPQGFVDKLEIYHGLPQDGGVNKKATTSMTATTNDGVYDNYWSTPASNLEPNDTALPVDQFIGTSKGVCPTRQTEFTADTGFSVPSMNIGGIPYDQIVWWKYTNADYLVNSIATIRITGGSSGTQWTALRLCF
jgi:hypothetical protein